jgi:hypothetical protein
MSLAPVSHRTCEIWSMKRSFEAMNNWWRVPRKVIRFITNLSLVGIYCSGRNWWMVKWNDITHEYWERNVVTSILDDSYTLYTEEAKSNICMMYAGYMTHIVRKFSAGNICVTYAPDYRRMRASHPRMRRKCCAHLPREECATSNVTFGPLCMLMSS